MTAMTQLSNAFLTALFLFSTLLSTVNMSAIERREATFLDVFIKFLPEDDFCGARQCNISYAISLLTAQSQFDLQSLMLQDGSMQRNDDLEFEENTIIRVTKNLLDDSKLFLGLRLFDVPDDIQDYLVVDVTDVISKNRKARVRFQTDTAQIVVIIKQKTEEELFSEYAHRLLKLKENRPQTFEKVMASENSCSCFHRNCACCEHMKIKKLHLDDTVCVNVTYISEDIGVRFSLSVDNHVYYSKELSIRNPPPVCYEVPHLRDYASICVILQDVELVDQHLDGCIEIEAHLYHIIVAKRKLGCFRIPV